MHVVAAIALDGFYLSALKDELPVDDSPVVLIKEKRVLDSSAIARSRGVLVGQSLSEARAILGKDGKFMEWKEGQFKAAFEKWLDILAGFTGQIEPQCEHQALLDLSGHPDGLRTATELREEVKGALGVQVAVGIGPNRWIAEASCTEKELTLAPLICPRRFIAPMSTLRLEPVEWKDREKLMALGYRTIGQVAQIPYSTLQELFRKKAFIIAQAAQGAGDPRVTACYPHASYAELWCFERPPENWSEIEEVAGKLAKGLGAFLFDQDFAAHDLEVVTTAEDGSRKTHHRTFTQPIKSPKGIQNALSLMLSGPFDPPLERLLVRVRNLQKPKRVQKNLEGMVTGIERRDALDLAVQSLKSTFGAQAIDKAAALPVARFQMVRRAWAESNGWIWR